MQFSHLVHPYFSGNDEAFFMSKIKSNPAAIKLNEFLSKVSSSIINGRILAL
jgi:hypothetical protein